MLAAGDRAPDVAVLDTATNRVQLRALAAEGPLLVAFYPFDWTDTCRSELRALRDRLERFTEAGVRVVAISRDSPFSHVKYAQQQWLTYPLLSDWSGEAVRGFGIARELDGMDGVALRTCFLLDAQAVVRGAWRYADDEVPDLDELLAACAAVAPA